MSQNPMPLSDSDTGPNPLDEEVLLTGEYDRNGEFHRNLDPKWSYYPVYVNKLEVIDEVLRRHACQEGQILDAGCGEGVLVEKYAEQGWNIIGVDKNYASNWVRQGSVLDLPVEKESLDTILCLDVLEHLDFTDQKYALNEFNRVLKPGALAIFSVPNLAHFSSRLKFMFQGRLKRTASIWHHPGDRPMHEYEALLERKKFQIVERHGIFPTVPPLYRYVMTHPDKSAGLLRFLRKVPFPVDWNFQTIFVCRRYLPESG